MLHYVTGILFTLLSFRLRYVQIALHNVYLANANTCEGLLPPEVTTVSV